MAGIYTSLARRSFRKSRCLRVAIRLLGPWDLLSRLRSPARASLVQTEKLASQGQPESRLGHAKACVEEVFHLTKKRAFLSMPTGACRSALPTCSKTTLNNNLSMAEACWATGAE